MIYPVVQKVTLKGLVGFENNFNGPIIFVSKLLSNVLNNFCAIPWQQCAAEDGCYLRYLPQKVLWEGTKIFCFLGDLFGQYIFEQFARKTNLKKKRRVVWVLSEIFTSKSALRSDQNLSISSVRTSTCSALWRTNRRPGERPKASARTWSSRPVWRHTGS